MSREQRTLIVPEGVAGERIDSALTRVLGLSRTSIVKLLEDGDIRSDGKALAKSERVAAGQMIDVLMPEQVSADPIPLTPLDGLSIVYNDEEIVVIYHSHTETEAFPSRTDIAYAGEPGAHYVLVSSRKEIAPAIEFRSYRIIDGVVTEEEVSITE